MRSDSRHPVKPLASAGPFPTRSATQEQIPADPFRERHRPLLRARFRLLGGRFEFETDSAPLLNLVRHAYSNLPPHLFAPAPRLTVRLLTAAESPRPTRTRMRRPAATAALLPGQHESEPPVVRALSGGGMLCGVLESATFMAVTPAQRSALVVISPEMLAFPYHLRYELIEFAAYVLAARVQRLVPLHAACVGSRGNAILLLGASGAGKSTLTLQCLVEGLEFLAEDSVLVESRRLLATGVSTFLHLRRDSLKFASSETAAALLQRATVIRRRSGVEKLEIDLRRRFSLAPGPMKIRAIVCLSAQPAGQRPRLRRMSEGEIRQELEVSQCYAASQPGWTRFLSQIIRLPTFELRRGRHPAEAVAALRELLPGSTQARAARKRAVR